MITNQFTNVEELRLFFQNTIGLHPSYAFSMAETILICNEGHVKLTDGYEISWTQQSKIYTVITKG